MLSQFFEIGMFLLQGYSRIPIYDGERTNIVYVLFVKDLVPIILNCFPLCFPLWSPCLNVSRPFEATGVKRDAAGNPFWRGRISTVDLYYKISYLNDGEPSISVRVSWFPTSKIKFLSLRFFNKAGAYPNGGSCRDPPLREVHVTANSRLTCQGQIIPAYFTTASAMKKNV